MCFLLGAAKSGAQQRIKLSALFGSEQIVAIDNGLSSRADRDAQIINAFDGVGAYLLAKGQLTRRIADRGGDISAGINLLTRDMKEPLQVGAADCG